MLQLTNKFSFFFMYACYLKNLFPKIVSYISSTQTNLNMLNIVLAGDKYLLILMKFAKFNTNFRFQSLLDISVIDYPYRLDSRFTIYYMLASYSPNPLRLLVQFSVPANVKLFSLTQHFRSANWLEREVYDMFGLYFINHPDLRRILTDYGFEGFPLRKDFPLTGYFELRYDEEQKKILIEPVTVQQSFRSFEFLSPWRLLNY